MLLKRYKIIYIHVPKTGGNSLSQLLMPFSSDRLVTKGNQDGEDRFEVRGNVTRTKHQPLSVYAANLAKRSKLSIDDYRIAITVREPLSRAISFYFSPHRWTRVRDGETVSVPHVWSFDRFERAIPNLKSVSSSLMLDEGYRAPDFVIHHENYEREIADFLEASGIPANIADLGRSNASTADKALKQEALADPRVREMVRERFADDYRNFYPDEPAPSSDGDGTDGPGSSKV